MNGAGCTGDFIQGPPTSTTTNNISSGDNGGPIVVHCSAGKPYLYYEIHVPKRQGYNLSNI